MDEAFEEGIDPLMRLPGSAKTGLPDLDRSLGQFRRLLEYEGPVEQISGWLADNAQTIVLGKLPDDAFVLRAHLQVTENFNSDGTDEIQCGWDTDNDAIFTLTDASGAGIKSVTMGSNVGYNAAEQMIKAYYVNGGSEPSTGKALVIVEFVRVTRQIS